LLSLVETFNEIDPDIVVTEGGDSFIFPYLARRAYKNGMLNRLVLGRDPSPLRVYEVQGHSYFSYGKILYRETAARLLGRLHIDGHNAFISADCGLEGLFEISRTCIIPIQRASRATIGTNMTSLQLYHAFKKEVLIPWNKNQPEELKDSEELVNADRGGFIYGPATGIQEAKKRNKRRPVKRKVRSTPVSPQMDTCLLFRISRIQECSFRQNRCAHCNMRLLSSIPRPCSGFSPSPRLQASPWNCRLYVAFKT